MCGDRAAAEEELMQPDALDREQALVLATLRERAGAVT